MSGWGGLCVCVCVCVCVFWIVRCICVSVSVCGYILTSPLLCMLWAKAYGGMLVILISNFCCKNKSKKCLRFNMLVLRVVKALRRQADHLTRCPFLICYSFWYVIYKHVNVIKSLQALKKHIAIRHILICCSFWYIILYFMTKKIKHIYILTCCLFWYITYHQVITIESTLLLIYCFLFFMNKNN